MEVIKARPKGSKKNGNADVAITYIRNIYAVEKDADERALSAEGWYQLRQEKSVPLLREFRKWLEDISSQDAAAGFTGQSYLICT